MDDLTEDLPTVLRMFLHDAEGLLLWETDTTDTPEEMTWEGRSFVRTEVSESHVMYHEVPGEAPADAQ